MEIFPHLPVLLVIFNLATAFVIPLIYQFRRQYGSVFIVLNSTFALVLTVLILGYVEEFGPYRYHPGSWAPTIGIELTIDHLAVLMITLFEVISFLVVMYTLAEIRRELASPKVGWYMTLIFLIKASLMGMVMSNDLFNMFVFVEVSLLASVAIVAIKDTPQAVQASLKYLMLNAIASACILLAIGMTYMITGELNLSQIHLRLAQTALQYPRIFLTVLSFFVIGFGLKAALFPLHIWLPDAHSTAPTPSSALLSGLVVKGYIVALIRILYQMIGLPLLQRTPVLEMLKWMSVAAIVVGSVFALTQKDIKRLLAYSTVSQIGYIFLGIATANPAALTGAILHIINHAFMKVTLFLAAGAIIFKTGKRSTDTLIGIGREMPYSMAAFTVAALAMVGIPPLNGFFSKWYLAMGSLNAGNPVFLIVIILSSLLSGAYYLPVIIRAFFPQEEVHHAEEPERIRPDRGMLFPILCVAAGNLVAGLGIDRIMPAISHVVRTLI